MYNDDTNLLKNILKNEHLSQADLAKMMNSHRQYINQLVLGKRNIGASIKSKLEKLFPKYFKIIPFDLPGRLTPETLTLFRKHFSVSQFVLAKKLGVSQTLICQCEKGEREITLELETKIRELNNNFKLDVSNIKPVLSSHIIELKYYPKLSVPDNLDFNNAQYEVLYIDDRLFSAPFDINTSSCCLVSVKSDCTASDYINFDKVVIDTSVNRFTDGHTFVFRYKNQNYISKINVLPDKVKCIPLNQKFDTFYINQEDTSVIYGVVLRML